MQYKTTWMIWILTSVVTQVHPEAPGNARFCYDRFGPMPLDGFIQRSCTLCYAYLFQGRTLRPSGTDLTLLVSVNDSLTDPGRSSDSPGVPTPVAPDARNDSTLQEVCATLNADECSRWRSCCHASMLCCERQLETTYPGGGDSTGAAPGCQRTWDGFTCWPDSPPASHPVAQCPSYLEHSLTTRQTSKECLANGTWYKKQGREWTDYTPCLDKEGYLVSVYIAVGFNSASFLLLIPAVVIFSAFRGLYSQHRVRLHINFFLSLALICLTNVLWYQLVHYDLLVNPVSSETVMYRNPTWCRFLSFMKIYVTSTNYFWAFSEGFYLHHLIAKAFEPPKTLLPLYLLGWAVPFVPALIYGVLRAALDNTSCWAKSYGHYEWIIYGPNLVCIVMNLLFLCNIMRILMFQLHSHPHEPSNFRRGLKAVFMLIPLFGLQLFLTIYRLPPGTAGEKEYEYMTFVVTSSQGMFVSLIFCFFNGEVLSQVRAGCCCRCNTCQKRSKKNQQHGGMHMTMVTVADYDRSPALSSKSSHHNNENNGAGESVECNGDYSQVPTYPCN